MMLSVFLALQAGLGDLSFQCKENPAHPQFERSVTIAAKTIENVGVTYLQAEVSKNYHRGPTQLEIFTVRLHDLGGLATFNDYLNPKAFRLDVYPSYVEDRFLGRMTLHVNAVTEEYIQNLDCGFSLSHSEPLPEVIQVTGSNGKCAPEMIHVDQGETRKLKLLGDDMYLFTAPELGIELMNMPGQSAEQTITFERSGTYPFSCGKHGSPEQTRGSIMVM